MQSNSQTRMRLILLAVLQAAVLVTSIEIEDRDKRQTQPYYTASIPSRGPTPKPQPFASGQQTIVPRFPPFSPAPQGFRSSPADDEADQVDRNAVSPTPQYLLVRPQPTQQPAQYRSPAPQQIHQQQQSNQQQQQRARPPNNQDFRRPNINQKNQQQLTEEELAELEEEEKEEPDRLTQLLPNSKFSCSSRNTGYYADEGLNCEVFHYCQDNARHSWICPEGFLFHQVHLICMPPSSDNICKQSSNFHFVNDYLYRPINEEEVQRKPNVTLRYADRYYPENYYEEEENHAAPQPAQVRRPVQQNPNYQQQNQARTPVPQQYRQASTTNQVFHSPEEVNIPLQHRRPQYQQSSQSEEEY